MPWLQVEEMKALVRVIPLWATTIILNTVFLQIVSFGAQEAMTMDRRLGSIVIPAASVPVAAAFIILLFLPFYDRVLVPFLRKYTGDPRGISFLQRIGFGLFISIVAAVVAALIEKKRRQVHINRRITKLMNRSNMSKGQFWYMQSIHFATAFAHSSPWLGPIRVSLMSSPYPLRWC